MEAKILPDQGMDFPKRKVHFVFLSNGALALTYAELCFFQMSEKLIVFEGEPRNFGNN